MRPVLTPGAIALARIERDREAAMARHRRDRDARALERVMSARDEQERAARVSRSVDVLTSAERVEYLRDLPRLWADAPASRRAIAESLFARVEVLGLRRAHIEPTPEAARRGLVEAFYAGGSHGYGRGERSKASINDLPITMRLDEPPGRLELVRSA